MVLAFFLLPIIATLLWGRVFCGTACPIGGLQDVVLLKPHSIPGWLEHAMGLLAWAFLAVAVLLAATGSLFIICQFDPMVGFFRLSMPLAILGISVIFLLVSTVLGRFYCRVFCPLGALFRPISRLSFKNARITPEDCVHCRLCEDACPFGAIRPPTRPLTESQKRSGRRRLAALIPLLPILVVLGGWLGSQTAPVLARANYKVRLGERVARVQASEGWGESDLDEAFSAGEATADQVVASAQAKRQQFVTGTWVAGGFFGFVVGLKLIGLSIHRTRSEWTIDKARCFSCGRCFESCPIEHRRRGRGRGGDV
jgi:ferredoxin